MPLAEAPMAVLATALRDPNVVIRYQAKIVTVPGSDFRLVAVFIPGEHSLLTPMPDAQRTPTRASLRHERWTKLWIG